MATTIDQLKSLFQKAKKKTLDATTIDEKLGQGLRSVARSVPVQSLVRSTASMVSPIANPMIAGATSANNYLKYRTSPTVVAQAQQNKVQFQKQLDYGKQNTYAPTFVPIVQQLSAKFPQIPNTVEKAARFLPDKAAQFAFNANPLNKRLMPNANPKNNIVSNLIGGFARGAVEVLPETLSGNKKIMDSYRGKFANLTPQEKAAMQNENTGFMAGLLAGPKAKGFDLTKQGTFSNLMDKKVRFEIDDGGAKLLVKNIGGSGENDIRNVFLRSEVRPRGSFGQLSLEKVLKHDKFFTQYPEARKIPVVLLDDSRGATAAFYDPKQNFIGIPAGEFGEYSKNLKSTLLHEIQHAIQQKEGFAKGGSPETFKINNQIGDLIQEQQKQLMDEYGFEKWSFDLLLNNPTKHKQLMDEGVKAGYSLEPMYREFAKKLDPQDAEYFVVRAKQFDKDLSNQRFSKDPMNSYQRLAGEIESRAVQRRMDMPMSQRLSTDPYQAEMTATGIKSPQDAIVRFDETLSELSTKGKMKFRPTQALTKEEINIVDQIITNWNQTKDLSFADARFIDRVLQGKAGASLDQINTLSPAQRMNEIGKFANISERANGLSMSIDPSAKIGDSPQVKGVDVEHKSNQLFDKLNQIDDKLEKLASENMNIDGSWKPVSKARRTQIDIQRDILSKQKEKLTTELNNLSNTSQLTDLYTQATTPKLDRTQLTGKQLSVPTSKLIRVVQPKPAVSAPNKTLRVVPNQPEMPKVPQSAQTNQLPEQPRSVYSQSAQKPKVQTADSWKQLASDKLYSRETADARMADAFDSEMNAPEDFKGAFARFIGNKDVASTRGTGIASQEVFTRVPKEKANDVIRFLDGDMADAPSDVKAFAAPFKKEYERLLLDAQKAGVPVRRWNDYVPHFWKEDPQQVAQMFMSAKGKFKNAKSRTIPTYSEGISMGLTPKYTHPAQILESYAQGLERVKAGMSFIKELDDKGIIVPASVGRLQPGFKQIIAPGIGSNETAILDKTFVGNYYAPTKVADQINRLFTEQEPSAFAKPAAASAKFQDIYLSGGLPGTPINAFTFGQTIKETTAGRPISAVKAVVRSFSPGASNKYFRDKAPIIEAMQKNNIPVQTTLSVDTLIDAPSAKKTFGEKIGNAWTKLVNEPTFKRFMPALQIDMFEGVQKGALKAGKSQVEADALAAQTVKAFYGVTGTDVLAKRSPLAKDLMTTTLFAPRFRESMINFWINNAKALAHPGGANKYNTRFLLGAALTYAGYDALNYANTGNHLWENPQYKKDKAMIPVGDGTTIGIPLLPSVAYLPRTIFSIGESLVSADIPAAAGEAMGLLSPLSRPIADLVRNKDYFGKQIVPYDAEGADRFKAAGGYLAQQYSGHPYVRELTDPRNQEDPMYQRVSRALEAPLRFYDSKLDGSIKVQAADNSKPLTRVEAVKAEKEKFDKLGKLLDKYENNPEKAIEKAAEQGFSAEDVSYYGIAREDNDVKTAYVLDQLDTIDKSELIDSLAEMRKKVGDKLILADGVIDDLYDQDLITSAQKKYLKSLDYEKDPKIGKYALKKGGGKKGKKIKIGSTPTLKKVSIKAPQVAQMAKIDFKIPTAQKVPIRKASTSKPRIKLKDAGRRLLSVVR